MPRVSFKLLGHMERAPAETLDLPAGIEYAVVGPVMLHLHGASGPQAYSVLSTALGKWTVVENPEEIHRRFSDARLKAGNPHLKAGNPHLGCILIAPPERLTEYGSSDDQYDEDAMVGLGEYTAYD